MRLTLVLLGLVLALVPYASSLFFIPIATATAGTTTTVTVSASTLATGAAVAAAGIVGLGLAAAAVAALGSGGDDSSQCHGYGCGGGSHGRRRRDAATEAAEIEEMFTTIAKMDTVGCGLRLVCLIYQSDVSKLTEREKGIRLLLGESPQPVNPKDIKVPRSAYQSAAFFGNQGENCSELYKQCPLNTKESFILLNQIDLRGARNHQ